MNPNAAYGLLGHALIFGAVFALIPWGAMRPKVTLAATTFALLVGIAPIMLGLLGPPSLTLLQLAVLQHSRPRATPFGWRSACVLLGFAMLFYLLVVFVPRLPIFALGYQPWPLLAALTPLGLALWWRRRYGWLIILSVDVLGYAAGIFDNLWDTLLDPLLLVCAALVVARHVAVLVFSRRRQRQQAGH